MKLPPLAHPGYCYSVNVGAADPDGPVASPSPRLPDDAIRCALAGRVEPWIIGHYHVLPERAREWLLSQHSCARLGLDALAQQAQDCRAEAVRYPYDSWLRTYWAGLAEALDTAVGVLSAAASADAEEARC